MIFDDDFSAFSGSFRFFGKLVKLFFGFSDFEDFGQVSESYVQRFGECQFQWNGKVLSYLAPSAEDCGSSSKMFPQKKFEKLLTVVAIEVRSLSVFVSVFLNDKTYILGL